MKTSDFDYNFPQELIAQEPAEKRDHSRLMVLDRKNNGIEHKHFFDIVEYLNPGDLLVLNDTKVIPANLIGVKEDGGARVEVLLVRKVADRAWLCLVKPGKRLNVGSRVVFGNGELYGKVLEKLETGEQIIKFEAQGNFWEVVHRLGELPLPPYIKTKSENPKIRKVDSRVNRYQTVYAEREGASAAPTAGLHFTPELLEKIKAKGIKIAHLTLHTGLATFLPVRTENIEEHKMHSEYFEIAEETVEAIQSAERVVAVGTTSVRALESIVEENVAAKTLRRKGESDLFIYPGYKFKIVNAMITNFHWPRSTLIMLVSAFAGKEFIMQAYQEAIDKKYRFFSFGDAMLIV